MFDLTETEKQALRTNLLTSGVSGMVIGLIFGFMFGIMAGIVDGLMVGLKIGVIAGLIISSLIGLISVVIGGPIRAINSLTFFLGFTSVFAFFVALGHYRATKAFGSLFGFLALQIVGIIFVVLIFTSLFADKRSGATTKGF